MREIQISHRTTPTHPSCKVQQTQQIQAPTYDGSSARGRSTLHGESTRILLTCSTRWSNDHRLESQEPVSRRHRPNTPAGELGLGLQDNDITAAAWDAPLLPDTDSGSDDATESVTSSIDSTDNVFDVYYDVHEYKDTDTGSSGVANPEASWAVGIR